MQMPKLNVTRRIPKRPTFRTRDEAMAALQKEWSDDHRTIKVKSSDDVESGK
jgi:hypothetical protein